MVTEAAKGFGIKPPAILAKPWLMEIGWRGAAVIATLTGGDPAIDKTSARAASVTREFDNSKIKKAIGIEFKPISESIKEICRALSQ
jgi:dihydroflavonol-4-reductase